MNVSIADLLDTPKPASRVVRQGDIIKYEDFGFTEERLSADPRGRIEVLRMTVEPGGSSGEPYIHGSEIECVVCLKGKTHHSRRGEHSTRR